MSIYVLIVLCCTIFCWLASIFISVLEESTPKSIFSFLMAIATILAVIFQSINL